MPRLGARTSFDGDGGAVRQPLLAERGLLTVAMTPRNSRQATLPAQLHDVRAAISWIRTNPLGLPVDPQRIGVWGHSAGGHLAASPLTALVGGDITTHRQQLLAASPLSHVTADAPPFLIIHGTADETIPFDQAVILHEALRRAGASSTLVPFDGLCHNLRADPEARSGDAGWYRAGRLAADFFTRLLP